MLIALLDEPGLFVFPSVLAAERYIEPIDAESVIRAAYDESGVPYGAQWVFPNRRRALLGVECIDQGVYRLVPVGPARPAALVGLLETHSNQLNPPESRADIALVLNRLRAIVASLEGNAVPVTADPGESASIGEDRELGPSHEVGDGGATTVGSAELLRLGGLPDRSVVTLALYGHDLEPKEVTERIGVSPTESHRKGDVRGRRGIPYRIGSWMLTAERRTPESVQECLDELLQRLPISDALWTGLAAEYDIQLRVAVFFDALNRGFELSPAVLARVAVFKASLVLDIYAC